MIADSHQLRMARIIAKLSIFEVATAIGIGRSELIHIEEGAAFTMSPDVATRLTVFYQAHGVVFGPDGKIKAAIEPTTSGQTVH